MNCEKRNKILFKNLAIFILIFIIIYIIVNVFFTGKKVVEGMSNDKLREYKLDADAWTFKPDDIKEYVSAYHDSIKERNAQNNANKDDSEIQNTMKNFTDLLSKLQNKLGNDNFSKMISAVSTDPDGKFGSIQQDLNDSQGDSYFAFADDMMKNIRTLMEDMQSRRAKVSTSK